MLYDTMAILHTFACYYLTNRVEVEAQQRKSGCHWGRVEIRLHAWNTACTFVQMTGMGPANRICFAVM